MATLNWDSRIGRRVRLRDLHILFAVVQHGSMAKAGNELGMSQSAVSQALAALEHALKVRLLDRTPRGVVPTLYADALMKRARIAFDELRQGIKDIESLADPAVGEVRIACSESISAGILAPIIDRVSRLHPRTVLEVVPSNAFRMEFPELHERRADVVFAILQKSAVESLGEDLKWEMLCEDRICLATGRDSPWSARRKVDFGDLTDALWILPPAGAPGEATVLEAFRSRGLPPPRVSVKTLSVQLRNVLSTTGRFIAVLPASTLQLNADIFGLKMLPIELAMPPQFVVIVTLKNRTLSPVVQRFIECAREIAASFARPQRRKGWAPLAQS
jgi:DNA-binding transcriptional LysR family regulator